MGNAVYNLCWTLLRPFYDVFYPRRVTGLENLPERGGFILCANHLSARDPMYLATRVPLRRRLFFLAKKELFRFKPLAALMRGMGAIPVDRGRADLSAVRIAIRLLGQGYGLGIFPQGTRSRDNTPTPMLNGAAMIALRAGVPVVPAYIDGPYHLFRRKRITFGAPVSFADLGPHSDSETLAAATRRIEAAVWNLPAQFKT